VSFWWGKGETSIISGIWVAVNMNKPTENRTLEFSIL